MQKDVSTFSLASLNKLDIGIFLSAKLLFPKKEDSNAREMYIISCVLDLLAWTEAGERGMVFELGSERCTEHSEFFYHYLCKIGGWKTLRKHFAERQTKSLRTEISVRIENAFIAGHCLRQALEKQVSIQSIAEKVSKERNNQGDTPVEINGDDCTPVRPLLDKENITVNVWRTFKHVSHYWAAMTHYSLPTLEDGHSFFLFSNLIWGDDPSRKHSLQNFLALAESYRLRGIAFKPYRAVKHLLDAKSALIVTA